jgi:flagellum-specific ATP synthase
LNVNTLFQTINSTKLYKQYGKVVKVVGLMIESIGPVTSIGDICSIHIKKNNQTVLAEVVGFRDEYVLLMPFTPFHNISSGSLVETTGEPLQIKIGQELKGKVLNGIGLPLDEGSLPKGLKLFSTENEPPNPMNRPRISEPISTGVRSIDSLLSVGKGQRIGIFAGSGVGKSTLMGMIARNCEADINVIALIGERGREVREFIEKDLGPEGLARSIVVVATSDQPALMRIKGAMTATAIAEFFREQGMNVLFMMDSVTRVAMAQREIGLAAGEPPTTKGYTPSVFAILPRLLERTGTSSKGSITSFYTVLVDGDDFNEPISDTARGILDGHFILDRQLANKGHFPAINILKSVSRVMSNITEPSHRSAAELVKDLLATYNDNEDLISIGAYKRGSSRKIDKAIEMNPEIIQFLKQSTEEFISMEDSIQTLINMIEKGVGSR